MDHAHHLCSSSTSTSTNSFCQLWIETLSRAPNLWNDGQVLDSQLSQSRKGSIRDPRFPDARKFHIALLHDAVLDAQDEHLHTAESEIINKDGNDVDAVVVEVRSVVGEVVVDGVKVESR